MWSSINRSSTQWRDCFQPKKLSSTDSRQRGLARSLVAVVLWIRCMQLLLAMGSQWLILGVSSGENFTGRGWVLPLLIFHFLLFQCYCYFPGQWRLRISITSHLRCCHAVLLTWVVLYEGIGKVFSCLRTHSANLPFSSGMFNLSIFSSWATQPVAASRWKNSVTSELKSKPR